jgi:hypothetical protein
MLTCLGSLPTHPTGICFKGECGFVSNRECVNGKVREVRATSDKPYVKATKGNLHLFADDLQKVTIQGGEVEYVFPGRDPLNVAGMADDVSAHTQDIGDLKQDISDFKQTVDVTIADKFLAVDQTIVDLNVKTQGAITEVKENFKETVDATLTPAVESLSFRMLKLEGACNYASSWEKTPASGDTLENFKAPVCETITLCKATVEFQFKAPTVTSDRVCQAIKKCTATQFIRSEFTDTSDRVCQAVKTCTDKKECVKR